MASETALTPSVEETVTTLPRRASSEGSAARTTATVPSRLTATTRSQSSRGTSTSEPQRSMPGGGDDGVEPAVGVRGPLDGGLGGGGVGQVDLDEGVPGVGRLEVEHDGRAAGGEHGVGDGRAEPGGRRR